MQITTEAKALVVLYIITVAVLLLSVTGCTRVLSTDVVQPGAVRVENPRPDFDVAIFVHTKDRVVIVTVCAVTGVNFPWGLFPQQRMQLYKHAQRGDKIIYMYTGPCFSA